MHQIKVIVGEWKSFQQRYMLNFSAIALCALNRFLDWVGDAEKSDQ